MYRGLGVKYRGRYSSQILFETELSDRHRKIFIYKILTNIRPVGTELFHADRETRDGRTDGQTDIMKLIDAYLNFANASKGVKGEIMQTLSRTFVLHIANF
jgi:hypothetical protein